MIMEVKEAVIASNAECDIALKQPHLYYDMKLVTFGIDDDSNLIILFPVFVQTCSQTLQTLYLIEIVPVPIIIKIHKLFHIQSFKF